MNVYSGESIRLRNMFVKEKSGRKHEKRNSIGAIQRVFQIRVQANASYLICCLPFQLHAPLIIYHLVYDNKRLGITSFSNYYYFLHISRISSSLTCSILNLLIAYYITSLLNIIMQI